MKKKIKLFSVLFLSTFLIVGLNSCSEDTDPANVDFFVGTYNGHITYSKSGEIQLTHLTGKLLFQRWAIPILLHSQIQFLTLQV
jgi:hypothetical protein